MEDAKTSNQEHEGSISSFNSTFRQVNELVLAFRLGKHFNRFQWHLKWGVFTFDLSVGAPVWHHLELLLAELVKLHPSDSSESPVKQIRSWRDKLIMYADTEAALEQWQSSIDEIRIAAQQGNTEYESLRLLFSEEFEIADRIKEQLRTTPSTTNHNDTSEMLWHASFDLGAGLDMAVMPQLNDLQLKILILKWDDMRKPAPAFILANDSAIPPWSSLKVNTEQTDLVSPLDVIRTALDPYSPPASEINRLKSLCKLIGISGDFPRFKGTLQEREESLNDVISKIENELNDKSPPDSSRPVSIDDTTKNNDNNSTDEATHSQSDLAILPVNTSEKPDHGQSHSTLSDNSKPNDYPHLTDRLKPDPSRYRDKKTEERDKWIYNEYYEKDQSLIIVFNSLKRVHNKHDWHALSDETQVSLCANRYAARKNLPIKKRRHKKE